MNTMNTITKVLREYHYILHLATCRTMRSQLLISKHKCVFLCWVHHHSQKVKFGTRRHLLQPPGRPSWTLKSVPSKRPPTNWQTAWKVCGIVFRSNQVQILCQETESSASATNLENILPWPWKVATDRMPKHKKRSKSWCCRNAQGYTGL